VLRVLTEAGSRGLTKAQIVALLEPTSDVSIQRTLDTLRDRDAKIEYRPSTRRWYLVERFALPLEAPEDDDVVAVLLAKEILASLLDAELVDRIGRVAEQLDEKRLARTQGEPTTVASRVSATLTLGTRTKPGVLRALLQSCRRDIVRIDYDAPWKAAGQGRRWYVIEPWAIRIHDGAAYLRAWRRDVGEPRTLRVAQIEAVEIVAGAPSARVPPAASLWGDEDPAYGIDHDRPGEAVLRIHGAVARWLHRVQWHPSQVDRWIVVGETLERRLRYRSCRELARRIASVHDAVGSIEPAELREEVERIVRGREVLPAAAMQRVTSTPRSRRRASR
jgi:predicted DNA-binding transcriptional regulator YafY